MSRHHTALRIAYSPLSMLVVLQTMPAAFVIAKRITEGYPTLHREVLTTNLMQMKKLDVDRRAQPEHDKNASLRADYLGGTALTSGKNATRPIIGSIVTLPRSIFAGLVYGILHAAGPDHIGTLITLSAASGSQSAFSVGAMWGLGHSCGMIGVVAAFMGFSSVAARPLETWAYYGDYLIGLSMVLCALYFSVFESVYVEESVDGKSYIKQCACGIDHGVPKIKQIDNLPHNVPYPDNVPYPATKRSGSRSARNKIKLNLCDSYQPPCKDFTEDLPLGLAGAGVEGVIGTTNTRKWGGALLGLFQGACCPMGLVGMSFMLSLPPTGIVAFALSFLLFSALGTGYLAMLWARIAVATTPLIIYRVSCGSTLVLGFAWIVATYFGVTETLEFAEGMPRMIR